MLVCAHTHAHVCKTAELKDVCINANKKKGRVGENMTSSLNSYAAN